MARGELTIGELARRSGCKVQTIRYYEQIGLIDPARRSEGNQRRYDARHADRLAFIRHSRELGFSLDAIRDLLALAGEPDRPCGDADRIARRHLRDVEHRLVRLTALKTELERMVEQCAGGKIANCRVIEVLSDHSHAQCLNDDHRADTKTFAA